VWNNGTVSGDITAALADLLGRGKITQAQNDSLVTYKSATASCTDCHGNPPATSYHQGVVSGTCANCHIYTGVNGSTHNNGTVDLIAGGGVCNSCHGYPPAPRQTESGTPVFGTQGQYSSARFEDYSGGGGAHLAAGHLNPNIRPSDGWTPCLTCHTGGSASHRMKLPIQNHISSVTIKVDPQYKFNDSV